jgi:hypothetical protein
MKHARAAGALVAVLVFGLSVVSGGSAWGVEAAQPAGPERCRWVGRATRPPERLSASQFFVTMTIERDLGTPDAARPAESSVVVNSTYGASYFRAFDIQTGTALEVSGYVRQGGQCVVDTLNIGTLEPGFEGYIRPPEACPTAGEETIAISQKAAAPLGCAVAPMFTAPTAIQRFQNGLLLHLKTIYALEFGPAVLGGVPLDGGTWSGVRDTYREPELSQLGYPPPAPGLLEPRLGFGKAWREAYGGPDGPLGWALDDEYSSDASWQQFERGIVIVTRAGEGLILYHDGRVWEHRPR